MRLTKILLVTVITLFFLSSAHAFTFAEEVAFSGLLQDENGTLVEDTITFDFNIYDQATGGTELVGLTQDIDVNNGVWSVIIDVSSLSNFDQNFFLQVEIDGDIIDTRHKVVPSLASFVSNVSFDHQIIQNVPRLRESFVNVLSNPSFEHWFGGVTSTPTNWTVQSQDAIERSDTATHGDYSANFVSSTNDAGIYQSIPTNAGVDYTYTIFYQRVEGADTMTLVAQEEGGDFTEYVSSDLDSTIDGTWRQAALTFQKPADGSTTTRFIVKQRTGTDDNNILLDEFMFQEGKNLATAYVNNAIDDTTNEQDVLGQKIFWSDLNVQTNTSIRNDGNFTMKSPDGTFWNCGVANDGTFACN